jgi:hypothetical protein
VSPVSYPVQDQRVTLPVRVRDAAVASAMFLVPKATAQRIIGYSGLSVVSPLPGRAVCSLAFIRYADGDLGPYHEVAVAFLVKGGAFIHRLPVNQAFTLEAGRTIWGFPKVLAEIPMDLSSRINRCLLRLDGQDVLELAVRPGLPLPGGAAPPVTAFSCLDGVTRRTPWAMKPSGVRMRPGGVRVRLGDHPVAAELRSLGLDRTPALASTTIAHLSMEFGPAEEVL